MPDDKQPAQGGPRQVSRDKVSGPAGSEAPATGGDSQGMPSDTARRRGFLKLAAGATMAGGLAAGYGCFAVYAGSFLYPRSTGLGAWQFVATLNDLLVGQSLVYTTPAGATVVVARQGEGDTADDFIALSSVCPHLGCQVHWESQNNRFFCPCHNGAFDRDGQATEGPPAAAGQSLSRFPLKVEEGLLYIKVPIHSVTGSERGSLA